MKLYKFKPGLMHGRRVALTTDSTGANLPDDGGKWESIGSIDFDPNGPDTRIGASNKDIADGIAKDGFVIWPSKK